MRRRGFIKTGLFAGALFSARYASALNFLNKGANSNVNVGIIGCGGQGRGHMANYSAIKNCKVVAGADVNKKHLGYASDVAKRYNIENFKTYTDFRELLADKSIDAVSITVPDHWHAHIAIAAIKAGKHLFLEKPFAYSIYEGRRILDELSKSPSTVMQFGSQQRSMNAFRKVEYFAKNGYIGNVHTAVACCPFGHIGGEVQPAEVPEGLDYEFWLGPARKVPYTNGRCDGTNPAGKGWYQIRDYSGGWVTAWGSHHLDCCQWALGKDSEYPIKVEASGLFPKSGVFDVAYQFNSEYKYSDGKRLIFTTPHTPHRENVWLIGDEGWVSASRRGFNSSIPALNLMEIPDERITAHPEISAEYHQHFQNFIDAILYGIPTVTNPNAACLSTELCHMCNISMDMQRPLEIDVANACFKNDSSANAMMRAPMRKPWAI